ncbi:M23 family metallopeptidase [Salinarimonas soli]|uniref:M23 family metallopeptidase n=1 Tax=Salinarimonas soli TaxID=1638099 RepID=A0A5B2V893_9HYPH|nr:M23 family metallopeptidase [Salinarimonas soli]KAA2234652.1 M23 family metallopeptidase [Salinarimonas soli]
MKPRPLQAVTDPAAPAETRSAPSAATLDVGIEPPLDVSGALGEDVDRRGVNVRWLGASILTALTGAALIGGAIWVAVEGDTHFAELPQTTGPSTAPLAAPGQAQAPARRGDKLVRTEMVVTAKQSFRAPVTLRVADREVIKVRPFVRIATNLSLTSGVYATNIPPFNPLRLFAEDSGERVPEAPPADVSDAEVSVVKRDLAAVSIGAASPALSDADVVAQIEEERRMAAQAGRRPAIPIPAQLMLTRTLQQPVALPDANAPARGIDAPFSSIEVRVVPENVTDLAKADARLSGVEERGAAMRRGETFDAVLAANGATPDQIRGIVNALGGRPRVAQLPENQQMRILIAPGPRAGDPRQVMRVILFGERGVEAIAAANDRGAFVSVTPLADDPSPARAAPMRPKPESEEDEEEDEGGSGARLYESLYETALKHDLPKQTVEDLVRIFGYDVDFQKRVAPGDTFEIFYTLDEESGSDRIEMLFAALSIGGETRRVYRFQSPEDGSVDYFDDQGRSLKKFLLRKPIAEGILRSGFGYRRHPILGYSKMHTGVDWANKIGTPIVSAGNGTVIKAEWDSGYGRRTEVQHTNGYVTAYNHQSRFAPGVKPGARVRQGQVIGYVGNTGLSTGPHLHYEVIVNGRFVDPMKIRVPRGRELDGRALADFKRQRETVDGLLTRAGSSTRVAQREGQ